MREREKAEGKVHKKVKSLSSRERLSGAVARILSDEPLEDKREALSPWCLGAGEEILLALWSGLTLYDRLRSRHWP